MSYRYTIPEIPPSNNKYIGREARWAYQAEKKRWAQLAAVYCRPRPEEPLRGVTVRLCYHFRDRRRRDPDNFSGKMLLDGLVRCGVLADDSFQCIRLILSARFGEPKAYTEIIVEEGNHGGKQREDHP